MTSPRAPRFPSGRAVRAVATVLAVTLMSVAASGCMTPGSQLTAAEQARLRLQTPGSVWWVGKGSHAVLQAVGEDGLPLVVVWNARTGKQTRFAHYRVVDAEPHAPRIWVVPDTRPVPLGVNADSAAPHTIDIAGDGIDSRPSELYAVRLDESARPRADVDARWAGWEGASIYSASVEIDVNKGACPSTLRFYATGGSRNAWSAKVPTDVVTFEPVGWSPSGEYFAVITQADESATVLAADPWVAAHKDVTKLPEPGAAAEDPPTWQADILVFKAADGTLFARQKATVPLFVPNAGANLAAWTEGDILVYFDSAPGKPVLSSLSPGMALDQVDPFSSVKGPEPRQAWIAGVDGGRALVALLSGEKGDETALWELAADGPASRGAVEGSTVARFSAKGGILSLRAYSPKELGWVVFLGKRLGPGQREAFAVGGPQDPVRAAEE